MDAMHRSSLDIINEAFVDDRVRIHLLKLVTGSLQLPDELGTGMGIFLMPGIIHTYGVGQPRGGSGGLTDALVKCLAAHGGELRLNAEVAQIVMAQGRAVGARLTTGETFRARDGVIGAIHPHRLKDFVTGLDAGLLNRARKVTPSSMSLFVSHCDLKEPTRYDAGDEITRATIPEYFTMDRLDGRWTISTSCAATASRRGRSPAAAMKATPTPAGCRRAQACSTPSR